MFRTDLLSIIRSLNTVFTAIDICHNENSMLYNTEFYLENVLQFNDNLHVSTLVTLLVFKISVRQTLIAVNTVLRLPMMDSK